MIQNKKFLLRDPKGNPHHLIVNKTLQLSAWMISGKNWLVEKFQRGLNHYSLNPDQRGHELITTQPGRILIAGVSNRKLIPFVML